MAGVSPDQLARYVKGQNAAPFEVLARLAGAKGVSLDWLATGRGPMRPEAEPAAQPPAASADPDLYGRVLEQVAAVYKECGYGVSLRQIGQTAAEIAAELAGPDVTTPEEKAAAAKAAAAMLRRQLRDAVAAPTGPAASKRGA